MYNIYIYIRIYNGGFCMLLPCFFHCHVKLPASIAAICPLGGAVTWASNGETCCTTTLSAGVPDWFGKQFLDVFGLLSFPRFPKVSQGFQGFPRFPKVSQGFPSPKTLFFHRIIYSNIAKMTGHTAIGATWWANFRNWPGKQVSKFPGTPAASNNRRVVR